MTQTETFANIISIRSHRRNTFPFSGKKEIKFGRVEVFHDGNSLATIHEILPSSIGTAIEPPLSVFHRILDLKTGWISIRAFFLPQSFCKHLLHFKER